MLNKIGTKLFKLMKRSTSDISSKKENILERYALPKEINKSSEYPPFSVAICVYGKDNPEWFDMALASIINQTVKPSEIVLVIDGPIPYEVQQVINEYAELCRAKEILSNVIRFTQNKGLGEALRVAVESCSNELIARMDSDDIAVSNRFELQINRFMKNDIDICGGQIEEFINTPTNVVGKRIVPETDEELKIYMKKRCPFNHVTVMYRKTAVLDAGNYIDWFCNEDYYLWIRMALKNLRFANVSETIVNVRVGNDMYARRGGSKYYKSEVGLQRLMLEKGIIDKPTYMMNCAKRFIVQRMMPNKVRGWVFKKFARS